MKPSVWILGGVVAASLVSSSQDAAARNVLSDFAAALFGASARPAQPYSYIPEQDFAPLEMTVKMRRRATSPRDPEVSRKPAPAVVNLDPRTDPKWYLKDPTLRRGDIVVTSTGVLVFTGRRSETFRRSDFASLGAKSGASAWQRQLKAAAAGGRSYFTDEVAPVTNQEAMAR